MTETTLTAEITQHTQTRGALQHSGSTTATLLSLINRALVDFVQATWCNYSAEITYTLSANATNMNLEAAGVTAGGSNTLLLRAARISRTNTPIQPLDKVDSAFVQCYYPNYKTDTTGVTTMWFHESERALSFVPVPSATTSLRIEGWYYAPVLGSGDAIVIPKECEDAFLKFCIYRVLESISDGSTGQYRQQLYAELYGPRGIIAKLKRRYSSQIPAHLGYVNDGTVIPLTA